MEALPPKVLILGLGNELLGDDAVGLVVGRHVFEALSQKRLGLDLHYASAELGGWRLVDLLPGYDRIVIVDSVQGGGGVPGACYRVAFDGGDTAHLTSTHGVSLADAIALAYPVPYRTADVSIYGVEAERVWEFGEGLSEEIQREVPAVVDAIVEDFLGALGVQADSRQSSQ